MFTGIIEKIGIIEELKRVGKLLKLGIKANKISQELKVGDSVAVNGVCLTIVKQNKDILFFDIIEESAKLTNLGSLRKSIVVNLEKPLNLQSFTSGHLVTGHIDGIGKIVKIIKKDTQIDFSISTDKEILDYIVSKCSIAVDGVSLTVVEKFNEYFSVSLIPHTLKMTTLRFKKVGEIVNLEIDILAKYIRNFMDKRLNISDKNVLTKNFLTEHGFL